VAARAPRADRRPQRRPLLHQAAGSPLRREHNRTGGSRSSGFLIAPRPRRHEFTRDLHNDPRRPGRRRDRLGAHARPGRAGIGRSARSCWLPVWHCPSATPRTAPRTRHSSPRPAAFLQGSGSRRGLPGQNRWPSRPAAVRSAFASIQASLRPSAAGASSSMSVCAVTYGLALNTELYVTGDRVPLPEPDLIGPGPPGVRPGEVDHGYPYRRPRAAACRVGATYATGPPTYAAAIRRSETDQSLADPDQFLKTLRRPSSSCSCWQKDSARRSSLAVTLKPTEGYSA
jgi:hypothetical protein